MEFELQNELAAEALNSGILLHGRWRLLGVADTEDQYILYDAMDAEDGRIVCIREFCPIGCCKREGSALTAAAHREEQFRSGSEEFKHIANALGAVPHVTPVIDWFEENGTCYCVTEKTDGKRLFEAAPLLTETYAQSLGILLCDTFTALHKNGIYYGIIREEDLLFTFGGKLCISTSHLSVEGSASNDLRGLTRLLLSMLPIERASNPKAAELDKILRCSYRDAATLKSALLGKRVSRRTIRPGAVRGMVRLAVCTAFLFGAVFGVKQILSHQQPLSRQLRRGKIEPEVISVWLPMRDGADEKAVKSMYEKLAAGFERKNPGCGVDIKIYADGSFDDALKLVEKGAEPPAVFMDTQDEIVLDSAADLTPLTSSMRDVYITDLEGFGNSLPLGCSIPALYYNTYAGEVIDAKTTTIDFSELPTGTLFDASASVFLEAQAASQSPSEQFSHFLTDASTPVLASSSCMAAAETSGIASGAVHMVPVSVNGALPVQYEMYCSVSKDVDENTRSVGMLWLQYLLTEEAQQILFVENYGDLPLHQSAFNSAVSVHSGMSSLKGVQLDSLSLQVRR